MDRASNLSSSVLEVRDDGLTYACLLLARGTVAIARCRDGPRAPGGARDADSAETFVLNSILSGTWRASQRYGTEMANCNTTLQPATFLGRQDRRDEGRGVGWFITLQQQQQQWPPQKAATVRQRPPQSGLSAAAQSPLPAPRLQWSGAGTGLGYVGWRAQRVHVRFATLADARQVGASQAAPMRSGGETCKQTW